MQLNLKNNILFLWGERLRKRERKRERERRRERERERESEGEIEDFFENNYLFWEKNKYYNRRIFR